MVFGDNTVLFGTNKKSILGICSGIFSNTVIFRVNRVLFGTNTVEWGAKSVAF